MKVWGRLASSAYFDVDKLPPHEVEIDLNDKRIGGIVLARFKKMGIKILNCRKCGEPIIFLETKKGKKMPITLSLISHFADCEFAGSFRKSKEGAE